MKRIAIRSEDPDQLCSFYEKTFGLRVVRRKPRANKSGIYTTGGYMKNSMTGSEWPSLIRGRLALEQLGEFAKVVLIEIGYRPVTHASGLEGDRVVAPVG